MKKTSNRTILLTAAGVLVCAALGLGAGSALGQTAPLFSPAGVQPGEGIEHEPRPAPEYPVNDSGFTYGSAADAISPETEPDLILVIGDEGVEGYVKKVDLDEANGSTAAATFKSPEEALAWQEQRLAQGDLSIPVYDADGTTRLDSFTVYASQVDETKPE